VNNDSSINIVDALLVAQYYVGLNPENFLTSKADTNCNGTIDIVDALLIAQYYVGLITTFPVCEPTPEPTTIPTGSPGEEFVPYLPAEDQVEFVPSPESGEMHVDLTFPDAGYRVADPGEVAYAAGINPDGTTYYSNMNMGTKIERYTGASVQVVTTIRITYEINYGDTTYFAFKVYYDDEDQLVKDITIPPVPGDTPEPTDSTSTPDPTPAMTIGRAGFIQNWNVSVSSATMATVMVTAYIELASINCSFEYWEINSPDNTESFGINFSGTTGSSTKGYSISGLSPDTTYGIRLTYTVYASTTETKSGGERQFTTPSS
jgi:hypothetical protein